MCWCIVSILNKVIIICGTGEAMFCSGDKKTSESQLVLCQGQLSEFLCVSLFDYSYFLWAHNFSMK